MHHLSLLPIAFVSVFALTACNVPVFGDVPPTAEAPRGEAPRGHDEGPGAICTMLVLDGVSVTIPVSNISPDGHDLRICHDDECWTGRFARSGEDGVILAFDEHAGIAPRSEVKGSWSGSLAEIKVSLSLQTQYPPRTSGSVEVAIRKGDTIAFQARGEATFRDGDKTCAGTPRRAEVIFTSNERVVCAMLNMDHVTARLALPESLPSEVVTLTACLGNDCGTSRVALDDRSLVRLAVPTWSPWQSMYATPVFPAPAHGSAIDVHFDVPSDVTTNHDVYRFEVTSTTTGARLFEGSRVASYEPGPTTCAGPTRKADVTPVAL